ncbi:MAG: DUF424 family protein [Candidatus Micrarchaeota archaeon]
MYAKKHFRVMQDGSTRSVLALCDAGLLGKSFEQGSAVLDLNANSSFYKGNKVSEKQAGALLKEALEDSRSSLNVVGEKSVACLRKAMPSFNEKSVKKVAGVPHAHVYRV